MRPLLLGIGFVILVSVFFFLGRKNEPPPKSFKDTRDLINYLSAEAVKDAETQNHVHLDYGVESIKQVETVLGGIHDQYVKNQSSIAVNGLASAYGAYLGEVIRRTESNAHWETSDPVGGEKSYPLVWGTGNCFPMAWCYRRIINGDEDNVWIKYQVLKKHAAEPPPAPKQQPPRP
jgi:hypothetical protein